MFKCNCGRKFEKQSSLNSHARFCDKYIKKEKKVSVYKQTNDYVCECGKTYNNHQSLNGHFSYCLIHREGKPHVDRFKDSRGWCKGLTKDNDIRIKKIAESLKGNIPWNKGKTLSKDHREKLAKSASGRNNGYVKTKWHEVYCPYINQLVKVQGTWELKYATYLNENNINWIRPTEKFSYKLNEDDITHYYHPDFYLIDSKEYVEIKGRWWKSSDGRVDDRRKMNCVIKQNSEITIKIIENLNFKP